MPDREEREAVAEGAESVAPTVPLTDEQRARVEAMLPSIRSVARTMMRVGVRADFDDLMSAGMEGLVQAAQRYDPDSGVAFPGYAAFRVRGAMLDMARDSNRSVRQHRRAVRTLEATQSLLSAEHERSLDEVRALEDRVAMVRDLVARTAAAAILVELDKGLGVADDSESPETAAMESNLRAAVWRVVERHCDEAERLMIDELYVRGTSMAEFAKKIGTVTSTVSRRHARLLERLVTHMRALGEGTGGP